MLSRERPARGRGLFSRLGRLFGLGPADGVDALSALHAKVSGLMQAQAEGQSVVAALREAVEGLEKQIGRAGKEQFKANALAEAQQQSFKAALGQLREADASRERELTHLRDRLAAATVEGRMEMVERLLPVLDGLGEALTAGRRLLEDPPAKCVEAQRAPPLRQRVMDAWALLRGASPEQGREAQGYGFLHDALTAWLEGLAFVQDRLLDILAAEGVQPMETAGAAFDPHLHVAVEAAPSEDGVEPGRVVGETRRGYLAGDAVLRYAEVIVTR